MSRKRGRPSVGDLTTPQPIEVYRRHGLPPELIGEEAEAFLAVINNEPADWLGTAAVPLLVQYARHVVQARRVAELIERSVGKADTTMAHYVELLKQQRAESHALATLATKLRLSPQSRRTDRGHARPQRGVPPWEA